MSASPRGAWLPTSRTASWPWPTTVSFAFVLAADEPTAGELGGDPWIAIPEDASGIVVREYVADRAIEIGAVLAIEPLDPPSAPPPPDDALLGEQLTGMAWTIAKLTTLHRTIRPELLEMPNQLIVAQAAELGAADTTPDNLYMMGTFRLDAGRGAAHRHRAAGFALLERDPREHLARVHRATPSAEPPHQCRRPSPARTASSGSWWRHPIRASGTGSTPVVVTGAS